jgi:hypothetical protein
MKEIRYASLLHDFGKVGVREEVLVKARKLYPAQMDLIKERFRFVKRSMETEVLNSRLQYILERGRDEYLQKLGDFDQQAPAVWAKALGGAPRVSVETLAGQRLGDRAEPVE